MISTKPVIVTLFFFSPTNYTQNYGCEIQEKLRDLEYKTIYLQKSTKRDGGL
jgi:hypothetical protein